MQLDYDKETNEVTVKFSINPKTSQLSSTGKTYLAGQDGGKFDVGGRTIRVSVLATIPNEAGAKKAKKK